MAPQTIYPVLAGPGGDTYIQTPLGLVQIETFARISGVDFTTTGQALVDITGLTIILPPNAVYEFEASITLLTSADVTGQKFGINFTGAGATIEGQASGSLTSASYQSERVNALATAGAAYMTTSAQSGSWFCCGILRVGAAGGTLSIQGLKVTSGTLTARVDSFLRAKRIS